MQELIRRVTQVSELQTMAAVQQLELGKQYPDATGRWTCGFFPGIMWQLHSLTGKKQWADLAQAWQAPLANKQRAWISQLDYGFIYLPSFAHSYEVTKSPEDLRQALAAAEALSWAYNPDFTINVLALAWAARHIGPSNNITAFRMDTDPSAEWREMAVNHAKQVIANHIRPDGSTYHIVEYNPDTGAVNKRYTYQGMDDNTTWARGQSWAVYGMAAMHNETGDAEFLVAAQKVADKWLDLMMTQPDSHEFIPLWDFNAPYDSAADGPRDSSAAAVAALGMLHIAEALGAANLSASASGLMSLSCGSKYLCAAVRTLRSLASGNYLAEPGSSQSFDGILKHGTSNYPGQGGVDAGLIYGDYYFLKAMHKCSTMSSCINML
eukprot:gene2251-2563_t